MSRICLHGLVAIAALLMASSALATAGHVYFVHGNVKIVSENGGFRHALKGGEIGQGETIQTGPRSSAQIRMTDGGVLAIRPATHVKIESYHFNNDEEEDNSFFGLIKGSFRAITGLMGVRNKKSFLVNTPTATIGIRGSDADMGFDENSKLTAVRTYTGGHTLTALGENGGFETLVISAGEIGIHLAGFEPALGVFFPFAMPAPDQEGEHSRIEIPPQDELLLAVIEQPSNEGQDGPPLHTDGEVVKLVSIGEELNVITIIENIDEMPAGIAVVGADMWLDNSNGGTISGGGGLITNASDKAWVNGSADVVGVIGADTTSQSLKFLATNSQHMAGGEFAINGAEGEVEVVAVGKWGVWQGGFTVVDNGQTKDSISGFHYAYGSNPTSAADIAALGGGDPVSFTYSYADGTATNEVGALATSYNVAANGNFSNSSDDLGNITMVLETATFDKGSTGWNGSFSGTIGDFITTGVAGTGSCTGCATPSGTSNGKFLGATAQGLLSSFNLSDGDNAIIGSAVLTKDLVVGQ
ncbi:MAG: FecR domain-containing protein [Gammaproteobacteria bacterium]|nr:FecR domain-containing protein [Gammaproteobacteria bacterium]